MTHATLTDANASPGPRQTTLLNLNSPALLIWVDPYVLLIS